MQPHRTRPAQRQRVISTRPDGSDTHILSNMISVLMDAARPNCQLTASADPLTYTTPAITTADRDVLQSPAAKPFIKSVSAEDGQFTIRVTPLLRNLNYAAFGDGLSLIQHDISKPPEKHKISQILISSDTNALRIERNDDGSYQIIPQYQVQLISSHDIINRNITPDEGVRIDGNMTIEKVRTSMLEMIKGFDIDSLLPQPKKASQAYGTFVAGAPNRMPSNSLDIEQPLVEKSGDDEGDDKNCCPCVIM